MGAEKKQNMWEMWKRRRDAKHIVEEFEIAGNEEMEWKQLLKGGTENISKLHNSLEKKAEGEGERRTETSRSWPSRYLREGRAAIEGRATWSLWQKR